MTKGICKRDNTAVRPRMLCYIGTNGFEPSAKFQKRLDRIASPIHQDLAMRDDAQCSRCKFYEAETPA